MCNSCRDLAPAGACLWSAGKRAESNFMAAAPHVQVVEYLKAIGTPEAAPLGEALAAALPGLKALVLGKEP